jgi:serine/threonine protein kinase
MSTFSGEAPDRQDGLRASIMPENPVSPERLWVLGARYVLQVEVARGGVTSIYRALDRESGRTVALRVFNQRFQADPRFAIRFRQQMLAITSLAHENLVAVLDYGVLDGRYYIAMEWVSGTNLKTYLVEHGPLSPGLAAFIAVKVCAALDAVHHSGLLHRNIKSQNVLVSREGEIKVNDVGLSGLYSESGLSRTNVMVGSVGYMSPEQARGEQVGPEADIYSLGILLYEMLTNRLPFQSKDTWEVLRMHVNLDAPTPRRFNSAIPAGLATVVLTALQKEPAQRFASVREMADALEPFQDSQGLRIVALQKPGLDRGLVARLHSLARFLAGPSPAPLHKLPFGALLAVLFAIGLAASFLVFYILLGLVAR